MELYGTAGWKDRMVQDRVVEALDLERRVDGYAASFVRLYVREIDVTPEAVEDLSERLMELAAEMCTRECNDFDKTNLCETIYEFEKKDGQMAEMVVSESPMMSDVCLRVWEAGFYLFECILSEIVHVENMRVAELGAGTGLTAVALHHAGASHILLTDHKTEAIENLQCNIERNNLTAAVSTALLDVERMTSDEISQLLQADVLLGAGEQFFHVRIDFTEAKPEINRTNSPHTTFAA